MIASGVPALPYDDPAGYTAPAAFGPFRVLHQIGSGALGPVFRAFESTEERLIAVKAFRLDIVPESTARLADALRALAAAPVQSPHVIAPVAAGLEGHTAFLASDYVAGQTLDQVIRAEAPAPLAQVIDRLRLVAEAIDAAWRQGIGHGALHPRDVIVTADGTVHVGGFGVVQACERALVKVPLRRPYASPERLAGRPWDQRADVYALGVIAHEWLTGRRPSAPGEQDGALVTAASPEERVAIRRALSAALAVEPSARCTTAAEFVEALAGGAVPVGAASPVAQSLFDVEEEQVQQVQQVQQVPQVQQVQQVPDVPQVQQVQQVPDVPLVRTPPAFEHYRPVQVPVVDETRGSRSYLVVGLLLGLLGGGLLGVWWQGARQAPTTPVTAQEEAQDTPATEVPVADVTTPAPVPEGPAAAAEVPTRGRLLVRTTPAGATVRLNGRARGTSPATIRDLPFGTYNVTVSQPGYQPRSQRVTVSRRVPARDITIELRPVAPPASAAAAAGATTGSVYVETRPAGAQVTIDGTARGTSPLRVPELSPGTHTIRLDLAGHKSVTTTAVVRAGQQVSVRVSLEVQ